MAAVRRGPERGDVAGPGVGQLTGGGVEAQEGAGGEELAVQRQQEIVGPAQHLPRVDGGGRQGAQTDPDLPHERGRLDVVALHIADREPERAVGQDEAVVPVATDVQAVAGRRVPGRRPQARHGRQPRREQPALQRHRQIDPGPVQLGVVERLRGEPPQPAQQLMGARRLGGTMSGHRQTAPGRAAITDRYEAFSGDASYYRPIWPTAPRRGPDPPVAGTFSFG